MKGFVYYGYDPNDPTIKKIGYTRKPMERRKQQAPKQHKFGIYLGFGIPDDIGIPDHLIEPLLKAVEARAQFLLLRKYDGLYMPQYSHDWMRGDMATMQKIDNEGGVEKAIYQAFIDTMPSLQGHIKVEYLSQGE